MRPLAPPPQVRGAGDESSALADHHQWILIALAAGLPALGFLSRINYSAIPAHYFGLPLNVISSVGIILINKVLFQRGFKYAVTLMGLNFLATASLQCCLPRRPKAEASQSLPARPPPPVTPSQ